MNQDLMFFEAEAIAAEAAKCDAQRAAEAAKCDAQRAAEQHERDAKAAAKVLLQAARDRIKAEKQAKTEDWRRKTSQARTYRTPDEHAMCGIRWYCRSQKDRETGCYWHNCHKCGQPLIYTSDPRAKPQECKG